MKKLLMMTFVLALSATTAFAQAGNIGVFSDVNGTDCNLADTAPGLLSFYAVNVNAVGSTACQFAAVLPSCWTGSGASWLSDTGVWPVTIGNSQGGVSVGYGQCLSGSIQALTINVFAQGGAPACCQVTVSADPNLPSGQIELVDCGGGLEQVGSVGGTLTINSDGTCDCDVATQESTWGTLKAIYSTE